MAVNLSLEMLGQEEGECTGITLRTSEYRPLNLMEV